MLEKILDLVFSAETLGVLIVGGLTLLAKVLVDEKWRRRVASVGRIAYAMVNEATALIDDGSAADKALDKAASGLKYADDWFKANGWRPLKPDEKQVVLLQFKALHGEEKVAESLASAAGKAQP